MRRGRSISNSEDVIDSRDVIARLEELRDERDSAESPEAWAEENAGDADELTALEALAEEGEGCADWQHGAGLIRESYFEDYARELAEDIGAIGRGMQQWPLHCIDWEKAADELKMDCTAVDFDGVTYYVRG